MKTGSSSTNKSPIFEVGLERCLIYSNASSGPEPMTSVTKQTAACSYIRAESVQVLDYICNDDDSAATTVFVPRQQLARTNHSAHHQTSDQNDDSFLEPSVETLTRFSHRFVWLALLLIAQSLSSFVLKSFEGLVLRRPVIILFLTMLVGAGGNAGSQSAVLAIRGLAKGTFEPQHSGIRAFVAHEIWTGIKLATLLTSISFLRVYLFNDNLTEVTGENANESAHSAI